MVQFIGLQLAPPSLGSSDCFAHGHLGQLVFVVALGRHGELRNVPNTVSSRGLRGEALFIDVGKKTNLKGEVQVGYMPAVRLRQSLVPAAGGKNLVWRP